MTLRPEYSLGHSEYNTFLFAAVGEEKVGTLTVLTALTRLGIDPWQEAARLSDLPRETAARVFAQTIAKFPKATGRHPTPRRSPPSGRFATVAKRTAHPFNGGWTRQR